MRQPAYVLCVLFFSVLGVPSPAAGQPPGHDFHTAQRDRTLYVSCRLNTGQEPVLVEVPLEAPSPTGGGQLDQVVELPAPLAPVRLAQYLPRAVRKQQFIPAEGDETDPAIEVSIDGSGQSYRQWLVADNVERNRLISLIGTWRYMAVTDKKQRKQLFAQFEEEYTREPALFISPPSGGVSHELPAEPGTDRALDNLGCRISVKRFHPHFGKDPATGKSTNLSDKRLNPAALVEIELKGEKEQRWVFANYPDFRSSKSGELPVRVRLDCPLARQSDTPDFALVTVGGSGHELWQHEGAESLSKAIALNERIPIRGSRYTFCIAQFAPSGRLIEEYAVAEGKSGTAALQIETTDASGSQVALWLEQGKKRVVSTVLGPMEVAFGPRRTGSFGGQKWPH